MSKCGEGLSRKFDKAKKPYIYVGIVCEQEKYQGQGYMRKVMDMVFSEGRKLGVLYDLINYPQPQASGK